MAEQASAAIAAVEGLIELIHRIQTAELELRPLLASDPALGEIAFQCTRRHAQSLADLHRLRTALMGRQSKRGGVSMAEQAAPEGGAPRTRAALAALREARAEVDAAETERGAILHHAREHGRDPDRDIRNRRRADEADRAVAVAQSSLADAADAELPGVLDRLDAAEAVAVALGQYDALFDADDPDPAAMMRLRAEAQRHLEAWEAVRWMCPHIEAVLATGVGDG